MDNDKYYIESLEGENHNQEVEIDELQAKLATANTALDKANNDIHDLKNQVQSLCFIKYHIQQDHPTDFRENKLWLIANKALKDNK